MGKQKIQYIYSSILKTEAEDSKLILEYLITFVHYLVGLINSSSESAHKSSSMYQARIYYISHSASSYQIYQV
jgi:CRISPR/Cas system type I-B associated protein Csh2 (Cas7 group RAMP superfamily)